MTGRLPPTRFIRNRKMAIQVERTSGGTISTMTVNKTANQVSARK